MMALTTQLWTINALATELGISSRVLGKRLSDLAPDQVEQQAGAPGARRQAPESCRSDDRGALWRDGRPRARAAGTGASP